MKSPIGNSSYASWRTKESWRFNDQKEKSWRVRLSMFIVGVLTIRTVPLSAAQSPQSKRRARLNQLNTMP
jgi:hypothetical protein